MRSAWGLVVAVVCLGGCVAPRPEKVRDYNLDGVHLFQRGNYAAAAESFQAALRLDAQDPTLLYNLGECYDRLGRTPQAEQLYRQCLELTPNHADCRHALAVLLVKSGRGPEASAMIHDWLTREPKLAAAYAEDGWLWLQSGDLPRAQARLYQALDFDPHEPRALIELAVIYETLNRPDRAIVLYERILERNPKHFAVARKLDELRARGVLRPIPD
jgi:Flp pilus assembly protein TadD